MPFQISALDAERFAPFYGKSDAVLAEAGVTRRVADRAPGFPCRVSLTDARPGETVLLLNHEHVAAPSPYRASHAIFVREGADTARPAPGEIPALFDHRLMSIRAFDSAEMMIDADAVEGRDLRDAMERMLGDPAVAFLHLHNAKPGCYAARVDRA